MSMKSTLQFAYHAQNIKTEIPETLLAYVDELRMISLLDSGDYASHEHSVRLPRDSKVFTAAQAAADKYKTDHLKYIIVIGIGGSNLGTKAVYEALRGQLDYLDDHHPKMLFADTVSASLLSDMMKLCDSKLLSSKEFVINLVSKSGGTTESIANFELLYHALLQKFPDIASRIVFTTDFESKFWNEGKRLGFDLMMIPREVGGRYSVFSSVGAFPLLLAGFDVTAMRIGASEMLNLCTTGDTEENPALRTAITIQAALHAGANIHNTFMFNPEMESLGKWERQLIAESLGKEKDIDGKIVHAGITPIVSIGSTDLHSMAQLYFGGPRDKFTLLVHAPSRTQVTLPKDLALSGLVDGLSEKTLDDIMRAIIGGVRAAYDKNSLPFMEVEFNELSERSIGAYFMWRMVMVMYLAKLLHVNAFDQPNVEDYKITTRELLLD